MVYRDVDRIVPLDTVLEYVVESNTYSVAETGFDIDIVCDDGIARFVESVWTTLGSRILGFVLSVDIFLCRLLYS